MERFLIVSADDFGISESTNEAIRQLFSEEKITSAGILAPAPFAPEAARIAAREGCHVGVHWTLNSEWAEDLWKPCCSEADSLLEAGYLTSDLKTIPKANSRDVTRELEAQYQRLLALGCRPDHADSHCGTLYGTNGRLFFLNAYGLCRKYGLPFRFARDERFLARQFGREPGALLKTASRLICTAADIHKVAILDDFYSDPRKAEEIGGISDLKQYYEKQLSTLCGRVCEVFLHPSMPDDALLAQTPQWRKRVWEYEYLKSGDLLTAARKEGFRVVSWADKEMLWKRKF